MWLHTSFTRCFFFLPPLPFPSFSFFLFFFFVVVVFVVLIWFWFSFVPVIFEDYYLFVYRTTKIYCSVRCGQWNEERKQCSRNSFLALMLISSMIFIKLLSLCVHLYSHMVETGPLSGLFKLPHSISLKLYCYKHLKTHLKIYNERILRKCQVKHVFLDPASYHLLGRATQQPR